MSFAAAVLADGQLPDTQAAIYTVPADTVAYVKQLYLFNTGGPQTIVLALNTGGVRVWRRLVLDENEGCDVLEHGEAVTLEAGDTIEAVSTDDDAVDFTVTGVLEDVS